jgi:outer membrane beta-barrel protein
MKKQLTLNFILFFVLLITNVRSDDSLYNFEWLDQDKEIYVLQNRKFRKDGRISLSLLGSINLSDKFIDSYGGGLRFGYYFTEDWGFELGYTKKSGSENDIAKAIIEQSAVPYYRKIDQTLSLYLMWVPFYGKFNTFNLVYYLDWFVGLGFSSVTDLNNKNRFQVSDDTTLTSETHSAISWQTGFMFYLNTYLSLRLEMLGTHYEADKERKSSANGVFQSKQWFHVYDLNLGLQLLF